MEKNNSGNACLVGWIHSCFAGKSGFRRIEAVFIPWGGFDEGAEESGSLTAGCAGK